MGLRVRLAGLLVVLSVLLSFGVRLSHMLLVQHVICEHGHLVDERKTAAQHDEVQSAKLRFQAEDQDADKDDDHEHCDVMSVLYAGDDVSNTPYVTTLVWIEPLGLREARQTPPIDVIWLAPKASPPLA